MSEPELDDEVRALLETGLDSIEKFEIMQALRAAGRGMSPEELGAVCRSGAEVVEDALADLERVNLITREGDGGVRLGTGCADARFVVLMELYGRSFRHPGHALVRCRAADPEHGRDGIRRCVCPQKAR